MRVDVFRKLIPKRSAIIQVVGACTNFFSTAKGRKKRSSGLPSKTDSMRSCYRNTRKTLFDFGSLRYIFLFQYPLLRGLRWRYASIKATV